MSRPRTVDIRLIAKPYPVVGGSGAVGERERELGRLLGAAREIHDAVAAGVLSPDALDLLRELGPQAPAARAGSGYFAGGGSAGPLANGFDVERTDTGRPGYAVPRWNDFGEGSGRGSGDPFAMGRWGLVGDGAENATMNRPGPTRAAPGASTRELLARERGRDRHERTREFWRLFDAESEHRRTDGSPAPDGTPDGGEGGASEPSPAVSALEHAGTLIGSQAYYEWAVANGSFDPPEGFTDDNNANGIWDGVERAWGDHPPARRPDDPDGIDPGPDGPTAQEAAFAAYLMRRFNSPGLAFRSLVTLGPRVRPAPPDDPGASTGGSLTRWFDAGGLVDIERRLGFTGRQPTYEDWLRRLHGNSGPRPLGRK